MNLSLEQLQKQNAQQAARIAKLEAALQELKTSNQLIAKQLYEVAKGRTENGWTLVAPQWLQQIASLLEEPS